jgi:hypothetical protein
MTHDGILVHVDVATHLDIGAQPTPRGQHCALRKPDAASHCCIGMHEHRVADRRRREQLIDRLACPGRADGENCQEGLVALDQTGNGPEHFATQSLDSLPINLRRVVIEEPGDRWKEIPAGKSERNAKDLAAEATCTDDE